MKGTIDRDGYRYFYINRKGEPRRRVSEQRLMWEKAYGPIPEGMDVHHRDENKLNNVLKNFELITKQNHRRLHCGYELRNGIWFRPCRKCFRVLPLTSFYAKPGKNGPSNHSYCKNCYCEKTMERRERSKG